MRVAKSADIRSAAMVCIERGRWFRSTEIRRAPEFDRPAGRRGHLDHHSWHQSTRPGPFGEAPGLLRQRNHGRHHQGSTPVESAAIRIASSCLSRSAGLPCAIRMPRTPRAGLASSGWPTNFSGLSEPASSVRMTTLAAGERPQHFRIRGGLLGNRRLGYPIEEAEFGSEEADSFGGSFAGGSRPRHRPALARIATGNPSAVRPGPLHPPPPPRQRPRLRPRRPLLPDRATPRWFPRIPSMRTSVPAGTSSSRKQPPQGIPSCGR